MIKAIFFDCDGTLLSHRTNRVPLSTINAFHALRKKGIKTVFSSGRHVSEIKELHQLDDLTFDAYITVNGACTYDKQSVLSSIPVSDQTIRQIYSYLSVHALPVQFFLEQDSFINVVTENVIRAQEMIHTPVPKTGDLERILKEPVYLMVPFGIKEAEGMLEGIDDIKVTRWNKEDAMDLVSPKAGKEEGMKAIRQAWNITKEETMAFGDAINDLGMIKEAGLSVAMGNGVNALKECSDYVTDDIDHDGIYNALVTLGILDEVKNNEI